MKLVSSFIDDFLFTLFQQKNEIKKGKYPNGILIFEGCIDFKRNLTDGNLIRKCVQRKFDVVVFMTSGISLRKGF